MLSDRRRLRAALGPAFAAGIVLAGCGVSNSNTPPSTHRSAGYTVLTGGVALRTVGSAGLASGQWPEVPSSAGKWWAMPAAGATFNRTAKVELLATGKPGVRFHLQWQESCGGNRAGKHGVVGGSGGAGSLTLNTPALVLVKLPAPEGDLRGCYLATVVSLHAKTFADAKTNAPSVRVVHY
jgi:hypothetical protein